MGLVLERKNYATKIVFSHAFTYLIKIILHSTNAHLSYSKVCMMEI